MTVPQDQIDAAARTILAGAVVAFPTETVYGLGADATNQDAVRAVFALKGRPATNPLIVHCLGIAHARMFSGPWPDGALELVKRHWPGPLTIVVPKNRLIPDVATAGNPTVALRVPASDAARALIEAAGVPLVGPSANPSGAVSPTTAAHVRAAFPDLPILDAGPCVTGIESTVVTFAENPPRVLRPGVLGHEQLGVAPYQPAEHTGPLPAPGLFTSHYAPRATLLLTDPDRLDETLATAAGPAHHLGLPADAETCARELYARLRDADAAGVRTIVAVTPTGAGPIWDAIRDRLTRAAAPRLPGGTSL